MAKVYNLESNVETVPKVTKARTSNDLDDALLDRYARILHLSDRKIVVNAVKLFVLKIRAVPILHLITGTSSGELCLWKFDTELGFVFNKENCLKFPVPENKENHRIKLRSKANLIDNSQSEIKLQPNEDFKENLAEKELSHLKKLKWEELQSNLAETNDTPEITSANYFFSETEEHQLFRIIYGVSSGETFFWNLDDYLIHGDLKQIALSRFVWAPARQIRNRPAAKKNDVVGIEMITIPEESLKVLIGTNDGFYRSFEWEELNHEFIEITPQNFKDSGHFDQLLGISYFIYPKKTINIVTVGWDKIILFWKWNQEDYSRSKSDTHTKAITAVCRYSTKKDDHLKQDFLITGSLDTTITIWEIRPAHLQKVRQLLGHTDQITCLKVNRDEHELTDIVSGSLDKTIRLWDFITGYAIRVIHYDAKVRSIDLYYTPDTSTIVAGYDNSNVVVWNLKKTDEKRDKKETNPVTSIVVRTLKQEQPNNISKNNDNNQLMVYIGDTKGKHFPYLLDRKTCQFSKTTTTSFIANNSSRPSESIDMHHPTRINAAILFHDERYLISCDGDAYIKVCDLEDKNHSIAVFGRDFVLTKAMKESKDRVIVSESKHSGCVMSIAAYHPNQFGELIDFDKSRPIKDNYYLPLTQSWLFSGGLDLTLRMWPLDKFFDKDSSMKLESRVPKRAVVLKNAHRAMIRSIVIFHPEDETQEPSVFTGSYDKTVRQWTFNLEVLREFDGIHNDRIMFIAIYDPFIHYNSKPINSSLFLVTTCYDKTIGVWEVDQYPLYKDQIIDEKNIKDEKERQEKIEEKEKKFNDLLKNGYIKQLYGHNESVTALALFTPNSEKDDPLIVTGSIDSTMKIWNLKTGKLIRTRSGHSDRICFLTVIGRDPETAIILSGSDDKTTVVWRDSLYQFAYMPFPGSITRIEHIYQLHKAKKWSLISDLANQYRESFFFENPSLFSKAIEEKASSFIVKYRDCLSVVLPTLGKYDCLTAALKASDLISLRVILICWIENLNKDHADILMQKISHPSYAFPYEILPKFRKKYPNEFMLFISSINLVKNYCYEVQNLDNKSTTDLRNDDHKPLTEIEFEDSWFHPEERYKLYPSAVNVNEKDDWKEVKWKLSMKSFVNFFLQITFPYLTFSTSNNSTNTTTTATLTLAPSLPIPSHQYEMTLRTYNLDQIHRTIPTIPTNTNSSSSSSSSSSSTAAVTKYVEKDVMDYLLWWFYDMERLRYDIQIKSPVTSMMIPFHHFNSSSENYNLFTLLTMLVEVSEKTGNVEIFKSEVVIICINYAWYEYGRKAHSTAFLRYLFFLFCYILSNVLQYSIMNHDRNHHNQPYSYQHNNTTGKNDYHYPKNSIVGFLIFLSFILLMMFCYIIGEQIQIRSRFLIYAQNHFFEEIEEEEQEEQDQQQQVNGMASPQLSSPSPSSSSRKREKTILLLPGRKMLQRNVLKKNILFVCKHFLFDIWNLLDLGLLSTVIIGILLRIIYHHDTITGRCFLAVATIFTYMKILYYLRPYSFSGPLITMIGRVLNRILVFIFILFLVLIAYAQAIWLLNNNNEELLFSSMPKAVYYAYFYMLGQNVSGDFTGATQANFSTALLISFMLINLVLLNLMIALMNDEFNTVQEDQIAYWRRERAKIILEQQFLFPKTSFYPFLHVLKPSAEVDSCRVESESLKKLKELVDLSAAAANLKMHEDAAVEK